MLQNDFVEEDRKQHYEQLRFFNFFTIQDMVSDNLTVQFNI